MKINHAENRVQLDPNSSAIGNALKSEVENPPQSPRKAVNWLRSAGLYLAALLLVFSQAVPPAWASDHQDTTFLATKLTAADLTDLYVFESPNNPANGRC